MKQVTLKFYDGEETWGVISLKHKRKKINQDIVVEDLKIIKAETMKGEKINLPSNSEETREIFLDGLKKLGYVLETPVSNSVTVSDRNGFTNIKFY